MGMLAEKLCIPGRKGIEGKKGRRVYPW